MDEICWARREKIVEPLAFSKIAISFWETEKQFFKAGYVYVILIHMLISIYIEVIQKVLISVR